MIPFCVWILLAVVAGALLALVVDGGPKCDHCGWTENQCHEGWFFSERGCCDRCTHRRRIVDWVVDTNP